MYRAMVHKASVNSLTINSLTNNRSKPMPRKYNTSLVFPSRCRVLRPSKPNNNGFSIATQERNFQIAREEDLTSKFAKLICESVDNVSLAIRECHLSVGIE